MTMGVCSRSFLSRPRHTTFSRKPLSYTGMLITLVDTAQNKLQPHLAHIVSENKSPGIIGRMLHQTQHPHSHVAPCLVLHLEAEKLRPESPYYLREEVHHAAWARKIYKPVKSTDATRATGIFIHMGARGPQHFTKGVDTDSPMIPPMDKTTKPFNNSMIFGSMLSSVIKASGMTTSAKLQIS